MEKKKISKKGLRLAAICMIVSLSVLVLALYAQYRGHSHMEEYPQGYVPTDHMNFIIGSFLASAFFAYAFIGECKDYKKTKNDLRKEFLNQNLKS